MGGVIRRVAMFAAIAAVAVSSFAQSDKLRDRDRDLEGAKKILSELQQANIHSGRFYMFSRIRVSDAGFSEDYYLPTGDVRGGVNFRVEAPQRLYFVANRKTILTLDAVPSYDFLRHSSRSGQFDYSVRGDLHLLFNHLYVDAYTLLTDQLRAQVSDINRLATQKESESGIGGELKYSSRTSAFFSGAYRETSFPSGRVQPLDVPVQQLDRIERSGRVSLHHKTFPVTSLFVAGETGDYSFRRAIEKDSTRRYVGAGFIRASGKNTLRGEAGRTQLNFANPSRRDYSGFTGELTATRSLRRWTSTLAARRDLGFSIFTDNDYYISSLGRFSIDYNATRKLTLRTGLARERDDYDVPVGGVKRRDDLSYSYVGFLYAFRHLSLGADGGWYERESNFTGNDSGIRWVLHLSFTP